MLIKEIDGQFNAKELLQLFSDESFVFALESSLFDADRGRYSIIGFDPFDVHTQKSTGDLNTLKDKFAKYRQAPSKTNLPFHCGIVGFISYDYGLHQENIRLLSRDDLGLPDCVFGFYDSALIIDHLEGKLFITSSGLPETKENLRVARARERLDGIIKRLSGLKTNDSLKSLATAIRAASSTLSCNFSRERYVKVVHKALEHIRNGDIYQVNLSQRFCFNNGTSIDPLHFYNRLSAASPSSFGAYFHAGDFTIMSSSPERFLQVQNNIVQARPMKGTRPRGATPEDDLRLRRQMLESAKEKAELLMITDLLRNDLGRVCEYGSIKVKELRSIETYSTVFQATSTIEGVLRKDKDAFDLIGAAFPGGSITGCPKIRSMQIIEELEPTRRGIYTGSLGYIDFNGNLDFNVLIRTLLARGKEVYFQVGAGIVADSTPEAEYEETLIKAKAMKETLIDTHDHLFELPLYQDQTF